MISFYVLYSSLLTSIGWGAAPIFDKLALINNGNDGRLLFFSKLLSISLLFLLMILLLDFDFKENLKKVKNKTKFFILVMLSTFSSFILGYYFYFKALEKSKTTTLVVLITYVLPITIVAILSNIFLNDKFNLGMLIGLIISIIGIFVFTYYNQLNLN